jgi:hypothetical protein
MLLEYEICWVLTKVGYWNQHQKPYFQRLSEQVYNNVPVCNMCHVFTYDVACKISINGLNHLFPIVLCSKTQKLNHTEL